MGIFCYTGLLPKRCRRDLNPLNNKIFEIKIVQIAHIINIQAWAPVSCFSNYGKQFTGAFFCFPTEFGNIIGYQALMGLKYNMEVTQ